MRPTVIGQSPPGQQQEVQRLMRLLRRGTTQSGIDLFAACGIPLAPAVGDAESVPIDSAGFLSIAGFAGPQISGFVVLATTEKMLRRSNDTQSSPADWIGELGNQLLGRIKNRLFREGIVIHRVPPAVVKGCSHTLFCARPDVAPVALSCGNDVVFIWTKAEPSTGEEDGAEPEADPEADPEALLEGEMVLF